MKRMLLIFALSLSTAAHASDTLQLLYTSNDAPLAQALANDALTLIADPTLKEIFQPHALLISKDGLTDSAISQLGIKRDHLLRFTLAARPDEQVSRLEDAFNGKVASSIYYLYTLAPANEADHQHLQNAISKWYTPEGMDRIRQAGYTPLPEALIQQNRVTLGIAKPQFPNGYR